MPHIWTAYTNIKYTDIHVFVKYTVYIFVWSVHDRWDFARDGKRTANVYLCLEFYRLVCYYSLLFKAIALHSKSLKLHCSQYSRQ